jgi:hypothetical protein
MITYNTWSSLTVFCRQIIHEVQDISPEIDLIDWEAHANIHELPAKDLIGTASIAIEEESSHFFRISFTVGVSTFQDEGLFRHRKIIGKLFEGLRPERTLTYFDAEQAAPVSWMKIVDGTSLAPLTNASPRAFQFIQAEAVLDPYQGNS